MYIESRIVDHRGNLDPDQMNYEDRQNLKIFHVAGILNIDPGGGERVKTRYGYERMDVVTKFTDQAWDLARNCRQMRAKEWIDRDIDWGDENE